MVREWGAKVLLQRLATKQPRDGAEAKGRHREAAVDHLVGCLGVVADQGDQRSDDDEQSSQSSGRI
jgi:hypothetical protein